METMLSLAYLVQYGALVAVVASVGALVIGTVHELVGNKVSEGGVPGYTPAQEPIKGHAL